MNTQGRHEFRLIDNTILVALTALIALGTVASFAASETARSLKVTATAYNSLPGQGQGDPSIAAWGAKLRPGMRAIAVSRDLVQMGLTEGVEVRIDGLPDRYTVLDKTAKRWKRRIDIYMGTDVNAAKEWGKRKVTIRW